METDDEGETMLDSTTGNLVLTLTGSGLKGTVGKGPVTGAQMRVAKNGMGLWMGVSEETPLGEVDLAVEVLSVPVPHNIQRIVHRNPTSLACHFTIKEKAEERRRRCRNWCS